MQLLKNILLAAVLSLLLFAPFSNAAEEEEKKDWPPKNNGPSIAVVLGPEAYGGGPGYVWWDLGRPGRRVYFYTVFADTPYRTFLFNYTEPGLMKQGEKLDFTAFYIRRTGTHFFGIGPDREMEDGAFYQRQEYLYKIEYTYPLADRLSISVGGAYNRVVSRESTLDMGDRGSFQNGFSELDRPLEEVYPGLLGSDVARKEMNHYASICLRLDTLQGPRNFPVRGGYLYGRAERVDESLGADWDYWKYVVEGAYFFPLSDDYNIMGARLRWDRVDGKELPFYALPSLGQARFSTGYVMDRNAMRGVWENLWVDVNRALASVEYRHRVKAGWYPDSWRQVEFPLDFDPERFIRNMAWFLWADAGQVWPEYERPDSPRWSYGIGNVLYFESGLNQQITIGFSDEMSFYTLFAYGLQF